MDLINNVYLVPTSDYQASIPTFFCPCCSTVCFLGQTLPCCDSKICQGCYLAKYKFQSSSTINLSDSQLSLQNRDSTSTNKSSSASTITEKRVKKCPVCHVIQESSKNAGESWWSLRSSKSRVADGKSTASSCADVSESVDGGLPGSRSSLATLEEGKVRGSWGKRVLGSLRSLTSASGDRLKKGGERVDTPSASV